MAISKEKVREQIELILKDAVPMLLEKADTLLNDKEMINFDEEEDNYVLAKTIICALAREMEYQYELRDKEFSKRVKLFYTFFP